MHELAITQSVVDMVVERAAGRQIACVRLQVGALSGRGARRDDVLLRAGHRRHAARGVDAGDRARCPATAHCRTCGEDFELPDLILLCPCGSADVGVLAGRELRVRSVDLVAQPCA